MAKYLFVYHGTNDMAGKKPETEAEGKAAMQEWMDWFGSMGSSVIDGGNPIGKSSTINSDGSITDNGGSNPAFGYSLIEASSIEDAHQKAKGCPMLKGGGSVEIAEVINMAM